MTKLTDAEFPCTPTAVSYNYIQRTGKLWIHHGQRAEMDAVIAFFTAIDPKVQDIYVRYDLNMDIVNRYRRAEEGNWHAWRK